jgi:hypothetical protein
LNITDLLSLLPREYMKKAGGVKGRGIARVHITASGTLTDSTSVDLTGTVSASGASIQYPELPKPITDITLRSSFTKTKSLEEFRIENLSATLGTTPLRMAMTVTGFDNPLLDLSAQGSLDLATIHEYYPLEKGTELTGTITCDLRIAGRVIDPKTMRASGSMAFQDVSAKTAATASPVRKVKGTLAFNNEIAETKDLSLLIGQSDMVLSCRVKNYLSLLSTDKKAPQSTAAMTVRSNHIYTRDVIGEEEPQTTGKQGTGGEKTAPAKVEAKESVRGVPPQSGKASTRSLSLLGALEIDANVAIDTLTLKKFEFLNVRGSVHMSKGLFTMQNLTLGVFGGSVASDGSLDLTQPDQPRFDLTLKLNSLEAGPMLSQFTSFGKHLSGALTMNTSLKGALNDTLGLLPAALGGSGKVAVKNGSLKGFAVSQALASQLSLPELETIQFKDWANDFALQDGRLVVKDLTITALNAQYVVGGSQGLDGTLDYRLALYLPESVTSRLKVSGFAGEALNLFKDQSGRLKLDFNLAGTMDSPKVQLDAGAVRNRAEDLAKQKIDSERKKVEDKLKGKAGDVLEKLFKKKN